MHPALKTLSDDLRSEFGRGVFGELRIVGEHLFESRLLGSNLKSLKVPLPSYSIWYQRPAEGTVHRREGTSCNTPVFEGPSFDRKYIKQQLKDVVYEEV